MTEADDSLSNYASQEEDLEAIKTFHDKKVSLGRWSRVDGLEDLLPGMKSSPLFVVWQKNKA